MLIGFDNTDVLLIHRQGRDCLLPMGFEFWWHGHKFRHKPGGHTDGMSSPQFTHAFELLEPYGWALPAAVGHDGVYHDDIELWTSDGWVSFTLTKDEGDLMLRDLLLVLAGDDQEKQKFAGVIYEAVHLGGQKAFDEGRAAKTTAA